MSRCSAVRLTRLALDFFNAATSNGANLNAIGNLASTAEYQARFAGLNNVQISTRSISRCSAVTLKLLA